MILVDTGVLIYAAGLPHSLRSPCRRLLRAHADRTIAVTTTVEVLQEFTHAFARRRSRAVSAAVARDYARAFQLLSTRSRDFDLGLELYERYPSIGAFDAVLAAVTLNAGASALVSPDRGFGSIPQLKWIDPGTPALDRLMGSEPSSKA